VITGQPSTTIPDTTVEVLTSTSAQGMIQCTSDHMGTTVKSEISYSYYMINSDKCSKHLIARALMSVEV